MSSESGRFSFWQECEVSMWLLTNGSVSFSDGVCSFLGNGPSLFWLGKSKPFMLWLGKNKPVYVVPVGICLFVVVKKEKTHCILKASLVVRFQCESHTPWGL